MVGVCNAQCPMPNAQCPWASSSLVCLLGGLILLAGFSFKFLDEFFFEKISLSHLFLASVAIDLLVGCMLVSKPSARFSSVIGFVVFATYFAYQLFFIGKTCDCFGALSVYLGWYFHVILAFTCMSVFGIVTAYRVRDESTLNNGEETKAAMLLLALGLVFTLLAVRQLYSPPSVYGLVLVPASQGVSGNFESEIVIKNRSKHPISLLGNLVSKCKGGIHISGPVNIEPGKQTILNGKFAPDVRSLFASGSVNVVVSEDGFVYNCKMNWIACESTAGRR